MSKRQIISRMLFIALEDVISVISLDEKGKSELIRFEGETVIKLQEDFWHDWRAQTSYVAPKNGDDSSATICDFCFVTDKNYSFTEDEFLKKTVMVKDSIWTVEKVIRELETAGITKKYHELVITMPNGESFSAVGNADADAPTIKATTNLSDMEYKAPTENKAKQGGKKSLPKGKPISRKTNISHTDTGEDSPIVKYNKKLRAEETSNE